MDRKEIKFQPTLFSKEHKLILDSEFIELYRYPEDREPTRFSKLEIDAFRFGVKWIRGYRTIFGRTNCIDVRSSTDEVISIRLTSIYKIRLRKINEKYKLIINIILNYYASEIINHYLRLFEIRQPFSILDVRFNQPGIQLNDKIKIDWDDVDVKTYTRYVAISSRSKPDVYKGFQYLEEWNSIVLYNVIRMILKNKNLLSD